MNRIEYLLAKTAEEAGEVTQAAIKAGIFTPDEVYPETGKSNYLRLIEEFNDIHAVMEMLRDEGVFQGEILLQRDLIEKKKAKVEKLMLYSKKVGALE